MATNFYVDGPNLYYAALKDKTIRWLDLVTWCERLFPQEDVKRVRYFTAWPQPVRNRQQANRLMVYTRALRTSPKVSVHFGRFVKQRQRLRPVQSPQSTEQEVITERIKGVDVALASQLLLDAARGDCDTVVLVSNDSDFRPTLNAARRGLRVRVGLVNPRSRVGRDMGKLVDFYLEAPIASYVAAQFPRKMRDDRGPFHAPIDWFRK